MLRLVQLSRWRTRAEPPIAIPWLAELAQQRQAAGSWNPFGDREEAHPSDDVTQCVLDAGEPLSEMEEQRALPGLWTRR